GRSGARPQGAGAAIGNVSESAKDVGVAVPQQAARPASLGGRLPTSAGCDPARVRSSRSPNSLAAAARPRRSAHGGAPRRPGLRLNQRACRRANRSRSAAHFELKGVPMTTFTVRQGKRYRATISLAMLERLASNPRVGEKVGAAGFSDVIVTGSGAVRMAEALWPNPDATAEMPNQIAAVVEV